MSEQSHTPESFGRYVCANEEMQRLREEVKRLRAERDEAQSLLASTTDLLNSWARDTYVQEAKSEASIKDVVTRLWNHQAAQWMQLRECKARASSARGLRDELLAALSKQPCTMPNVCMSGNYETMCSRCAAIAAAKETNR